MDQGEGDATRDEDERLERIVLAHIHQLAEHFDGVQVFVSANRREGPEGRIVSGSLSLGAGNWYARYGQIREWLLTQEERIRCKAASDVADELHPPHEDADDD